MNRFECEDFRPGGNCKLSSNKFWTVARGIPSGRCSFRFDLYWNGYNLVLMCSDDKLLEADTTHHLQNAFCGDRTRTNTIRTMQFSYQTMSIRPYPSVYRITGEHHQDDAVFVTTWYEYNFGSTIGLQRWTSLEHLNRFELWPEEHHQDDAVSVATYIHTDTTWYLCAVMMNKTEVRKRLYSGRVQNRPVSKEHYPEDKL